VRNVTGKTSAGGPSISLVIATRNAEETLERCLSSFRSQRHPNKQLVVVDGASTDRTVEIVKRWMHPGDVVVSEPDTGIYDAWNKAIPLCQGDWISFLGADDFLPDEEVYGALAREIQSLNPEVEIVYGNVRLTNLEGEPLLTFGKPWNQSRKKLREGGTLPHPGSLHRKTVFQRVGYFDDTYKIAGDYEFQLRALKGRDAHYAEDLVVAVHQLGGISAVDRHEFASLREVLRARRSAGMFLPTRKIVTNLTYSWARILAKKLFGETRTHKALDRFRQILGREAYWTKT
jgi:glycosyltransferase involved in cell wall biosynthesis